MVRLCAERRCGEEKKKRLFVVALRKSSPLVGAGGANRIKISVALITCLT